MTPPLAPFADLQETEIFADVATRADSMTALASLLLDWRVECERHLRGLTNLQCFLERVRNGAAADGERDLLLQEMGRLLGEAPPRHDAWTQQAQSHLNNLTR